MLNISFEIPDLERLDIDEWCIIGEGEAQKKICRFMNEKGVAPPSIIYKNSSDFIADVKHDLYYGPSIVVIGSTMRYEIAKNIYEECRGIKKIESLTFVDFSPYVGIGSYEEWSAYSLKKLDSIPQVVIIDSYYNDHCAYWMSTLISEIKRQGFSVAIIHPWQKYQFEIFENAISIIVWNGAVPYLHDNLNTYLKSGNYNFFYAECGFFPQEKYFYLDQNGINIKRSILEDDLSWVSIEHYEKLREIANEFFMKVKPAYFDFDYVFCPLQVPDDTNVMDNSRFTHGMQEFIDYINKLYYGSELKVVFKVHPKDPHVASYLFGDAIVSNQASKALILGAKKVHGINSTVLFEAALAGKEIIIEGESLLSHKCANISKVLAAMVCCQCNIFNISNNVLSLVLNVEHK